MYVPKPVFAAALALALPMLVAACDTTTTGPHAAPEHGVASAASDAAMLRVGFPVPDPGIPSYMRLSTMLNQLFHTDGWLAIPMYRDPACIPASFNLLQGLHFPGPNGPGAFGCALRIRGSYLIEADAPLGTFPKVSTATGDAVPFWFVRWDDFQAAMADGVVTIAELAAIPSLLRGTAAQFNETLHPRVGEHRVVITARGELEDGRRFHFHVTHIEDRTASIRITIR